MRNKLGQKLSNTSTVKKLLCFSVVAMFVFVVITEVIHYFYISKYVFDDKKASMQNSHVQTTQILNNSLTGYVNEMKTIYINRDVTNFIEEDIVLNYDDSVGMQPIYRKYNKFIDAINDVFSANNGIDDISIYTKAGTIYHKSGTQKFSLDSMKKTKWYNHMVENRVNAFWCGAEYLTQREVISDDMIYYIKLVSSKTNYNDYVGAIMIAINKERILQTISSDVNFNVKVLVNNLGEPLVSSGKFTEKSLGKETFEKVLDGGNSSKFSTVNTDDFIIMSSRLEYTDLRLINIVDMGVVTAPYLKRMLSLVGITLIFFVITIFFMIGFWRSRNARLSELMTCINKSDIETFELAKADDINDDIGECIRSYNNMVNRMHNMHTEILDSKKRLQHIELDLLYLQLNPHFLFNTLSIINTMAIEQHQYEIQRIIVKLSRYYRISLNSTNRMITLGEEIEHIRLYVDLCNERFSRKIVFNCDLEDDLTEISVLKMMLQPAVENSILHGFPKHMKKTTPNTITLAAYRDGEYIYIELMDNGVGMNEDELRLVMNTQAKSGIGLNNTDKRLKLTYGDECGIQLESCEGEYFRVLYTIKDDSFDVEEF